MRLNTKHLKLTSKLLLAIITGIVLAFVATLYFADIIFKQSVDDLSEEIAISLHTEEQKIHQSLESQLIAKADTIGRFMAQTAAELIYSNNYIELISNQKQAVKDDDVIYAFYLNTDGDLIVPSTTLPAPSDTVITRRYQISSYDDVIGYVLIGIGTHNIQKRYEEGAQYTKQLLARTQSHYSDTLQDLLSIISVIVFLLLVILSTGIVIFFKKEVIGRLKETQQLITKLRGRNADHTYRLPVIFNDEISDLRSEVNLLTDDLILMLDELKNAQDELVESEKMAALGSLVAGVSHEINTPVGIAVTASTYLHEQTHDLIRALENQALKKSTLDKYLHDANESSEMILSNLQRAATLIQSFKQVAVEQNSDDKGEIELDEFVEHIIYSLRPSFKKTQITISENLPKGVHFYTYPGALSQVLTNLIMNSQKHAFELGKDGEIKITAHGDAHEIVLRVSDNGRGIPDSNKSKIFEPFFTTKRGEGGSGLGLNIVYNLVTQKLNGRIHLFDIMPHGAGFEITLKSIPRDISDD